VSTTARGAVRDIGQRDERLDDRELGAEEQDERRREVHRERSCPEEDVPVQRVAVGDAGRHLEEPDGVVAGELADGVHVAQDEQADSPEPDAEPC
jgi:hypothetical protein